MYILIIVLLLGAASAMSTYMGADESKEFDEVAEIAADVIAGPEAGAMIEGVDEAAQKERSALKH